MVSMPPVMRSFDRCSRIFSSRQRPAVLVAIVDERGHRVIRAFARLPALPDDVEQVGVELLDPAAAFRLHGRVMVLDHRDHVIGVVVQQVAILLRNAGQVTDDDLRQRPGDVADQIAGALLRERVDEIAAGLVDDGLHRADPGRSQH